MPGFIVAYSVSRRVVRVTFVAMPHSTVMQETEAFREGEGVKATRVQM